MDKTTLVEYAGNKLDSHINRQFNVFHEVLTEFFNFVNSMADRYSDFSKDEFTYTLVLA